MLSEPIKNWVFSLVGRHLSWFFSSRRLLDIDRFTHEDIIWSVRLAGKNHPNAQIIVLTDTSIKNVRGAKIIRSIQELKSVGSPAAFVLACNSDELALEAVQFIKSQPAMFYYGARRCYPAARYYHRDENARLALKESYNAKLVKFEVPDFENIAQAIHATRSLEGDYVEIGVYKGTSAYFALNYIQRSNVKRKCYFLDTFSGFDYEGASESVDRFWHQTHTDISLESVQKLLSRFTLPHEVIKSNIITDLLPGSIKTIAVCNVDVDMYEAVVAALNKVAPLVMEGGIIIAEDAGHTPLLIGAYAAITEFLATPQGKCFVPVEMISGQTFLIKCSVARS